MYYFIFEKPASKRLAEQTRQVEDEVVSRGLAGEMVELTPARNIDALLTDAHHKGYKTLVVVGGARLVNSVAARMLRYEMVLGIIPLGESPALFTKIKCSDWKSAVVALQHRRWQYASLGRINDTGTFLTTCQIQLPSPSPITITLPTYSVSVTTDKISVVTRATGARSTVISIECTTAAAQKSWWSSVVGRGSRSSLSRFSADTAEITTTPSASVTVDQAVIGKTPAVFSIIPKALRLIVAKQVAHV